MTDVLGALCTLVMVIVYAGIMFVPTYVAFYRRHEHRLAIGIVNFLLGWTRHRLGCDDGLGAHGRSLSSRGRGHPHRCATGAWSRRLTAPGMAGAGLVSPRLRRAR